MHVGGHCKCGIDSALCFGSDHSLANIVWIKIALDTRPIICLPSSRFGNNQLPRISRTQWKCMLPFLLFNNFIIFYMIMLLLLNYYQWIMLISNPLTHQNFRHIMKELQGAIIIGSTFQAILGYTGLMSLFLRYDFGILLSRMCDCFYILV